MPFHSAALSTTLVATWISVMSILAKGAVVPETHHLTTRDPTVGVTVLKGMNRVDAIFDAKSNKYYITNSPKAMTVTW